MALLFPVGETLKKAQEYILGLDPDLQHRLAIWMLDTYQEDTEASLHMCGICRTRELQTKSRDLATNYILCHGEDCMYELCRKCFLQAHPQITTPEALDRVSRDFRCPGCPRYGGSPV